MPGGPASYPLAVQGVALLALIATPLSALGLGVASSHVWALAGLAGVNLLALIAAPARSMPRWAQVIFLVVQCCVAVAMQTIASAPLIGYVYLSIVLQSIVLFPLWLWIPFAVIVYAVWSGLLAIATANALTWLQGNLSLR